MTELLRLAERVERLERDSHPPVNLTPAIIEILENLGLPTLDGNGWVYWNPDAGEEYTPNHPVESGECPDAERVRKSTGQEDFLWHAFQDAFSAAALRSKAASHE